MSGVVESVIEVTNNDTNTGTEGTVGEKTEEGQTFTFEESKFGLIEVQEEGEMETDATKPFECELCKKQFTKIEILKRHIKTHLKDKVCSCNLEPYIESTCIVNYCRNLNAPIVLKHLTEEMFSMIT